MEGGLEPEVAATPAVLPSADLASAAMMGEGDAGAAEGGAAEGVPADSTVANAPAAATEPTGVALVGKRVESWCAPAAPSPPTPDLIRAILRPRGRRQRSLRAPPA